MSDLITGPPYPPVTPRSNAFGRFEFGISPFGTIPGFNPWSVVQSEYADSPTLDALITSFFAAADQTENIDNFFDYMWNIETAQGYGLDVWGRIVGVNRVLQLEGSPVYFGFEQGYPGVDTFGPRGQGPFYSGEPLTSAVSLPDSAYRQLIMAKAAFNITPCTIPAINALLMYLFGASGVCYCTDGGEMSMSYYFTFVLSTLQEAIVYQSGVLPKPCGVTATVITPGDSPSPYSPPRYN